MDGLVVQRTQADFNPLPSCEGRPYLVSPLYDELEISIHSPHARGDASRRSAAYSTSDFNPLPSCEGRPVQVSRVTSSGYFNPLPSCEGRLFKLFVFYRRIKFQSTPLMRGETKRRYFAVFAKRNFNPLPSCEGRLKDSYCYACSCIISIHSPHARGDSINL